MLRLTFKNVIAFTIVSIYILALTAVAYAAQTGIVTGSVVNVRGGPSTSQLKIGVVTEGYELEVLDEKNEWYKVEFADGRIGWIAKELVQIKQDKVIEGSSRIEITGSVVNVRSGPDTTYSMIDQVKNGENFKVIGQQGDWLEIQLNSNRSGWVAGWLTKSTDPSSDSDNQKQEKGLEKPIGVIIITGSTVNIRLQPNENSPVISRAVKGTRLTALASTDEWYKVQLKEGEVGYLADWLGELYQDEQSQSPTDGSTQPQLGKVKVTGNVVNVRSGPSTTDSRITQVRQGEKYTIVAQQDKWLQIALANGQKGWIAGWLGQVQENTVPTAQKPHNKADYEKQNSDDKVDKGKETPETSEKRSFIARYDMYLYYGPDKRFPKVRDIAKGETLQLLTAQQDWYEVGIGNETGWIERSSVADRGNVDRQKDNEEDGTGSKEQQKGIYETKVGHNGGNLSIVVKSSEPIIYDIMQLKDPSRLVIDLPGQILTIPEEDQQIAVAGNLVKQIRLGQFEQDIVRVVLDVDKNVGYKLNNMDNGRALEISITPPSLAGKIIVIDPGHGSRTMWGDSDPGAIGYSGTYEKEVVLDIGLRLAELLRETGAEVIMTRNGDTNVSLEDRARIANNNNADLFVSIHANASPSRRLKGSSTYFYAPSWSASLSSQRHERYKLASLIQEELVNAADTADLGVREENFSVLRNTEVTSVLVETAFISNAEEEMLLRDPGFQQKVAKGVARGVERYLMN